MIASFWSEHFLDFGFSLVSSCIYSVFETSESAVQGTGVYSIGVGPKGLALERFPDIKKEEKV